MNKLLVMLAALSLTASCNCFKPEKRVHRLLTDRTQTLAVAESCTGGTIAARFTAMPGASAYFKGGVVAYWNQTKELLLGISRDTIARYGVVSEEIVRKMAEGRRRPLRNRHHRHRRPFRRHARTPGGFGLDRRQFARTHRVAADPRKRQPQQSHPQGRFGGPLPARRRDADGKNSPL